MGRGRGFCCSSRFRVGEGRVRFGELRFVILRVLRGLTFYHLVIIGDAMLFFPFVREEGNWGAYLELCLWRVAICHLTVRTSGISSI